MACPNVSNARPWLIVGRRWITRVAERVRRASSEVLEWREDEMPRVVELKSNDDVVCNVETSPDSSIGGCAS